MAKNTATITVRRAQPDENGFEPKTRLSSSERGVKLPEFGERYRNFQLAAHPSSWELVSTSEGWKLVPTLKRLILQAGVNWTRPTAKEGDALNQTDLEIKARTQLGMTVLVDVDAYLYGVAGKSGTGHFLLWENVRVYSDGTFDLTFDQDGYDLWRWSLVEDGTVEKPREQILSQQRARLKKQAQRATRTPHLMQAQEAKAEAEKRLKGLEEALKALNPPPTPKQEAA